jgi:urease accessory protein
MLEPIVFGRTGMGETVRRGVLHDHWRIRRSGKLIYAEGTRLDGAVSQELNETAVANGSVAIATALIAPADETLEDVIHDLQSDFHGEVGASAWNDRVVLRFCARDGAALRHDITSALRIIRSEPLPRLWIN